MSRLKPELSWDYIKKKVAIDANGCWIWQLTTSAGYGRFTFWIDGKYRSVLAHRASFFLHNGWWPENGCHTCDVRACCNPEHIYDGSAKDNAQDRSERSPRKAAVYSPFVRELDPIGRAGEVAIPKLAALGWTQQEVADLFEVHTRTIRHKFPGLKWKGRWG